MNTCNACGAESETEYQNPAGYCQACMVRQFIEDRVRKSFNDYGLPDHMLGGVLRYVLDGIEPGDFLFSVLSNNFKESFGTADSINSSCLKEWAGFMYNGVPSDCQGSQEKVEAWINGGGFPRARKGEE